MDVHDETPTNSANVEEHAPSLTADGQLSVIGRDCTAVPVHLGVQYGSRVRRLDLSFNQIRDLCGIEAFPAIEELVLDSNDLRDNFEFPLIPKLHTLTLNKNEITDLDWLLRTLATSTPGLSYLSLLGNVACPNMLSSHDKDDDDYQRYRYYVIHYMPNLKFLDSSAISNKERLEAAQKAEFLKVVRPESPKQVSGSPDQSESVSPYSPLRTASKTTDDAKATFGKCHYVYYGRHSEGNRFIRNNDL